MDGPIDSMAFADWLTLDERLRRAIKEKDQLEARAADEIVEEEIPAPTPPAPKSPPRPRAPRPR
jgi:hypothetical protein